jgi:hypothetical protein
LRFRAGQMQKNQPALKGCIRLHECFCWTLPTCCFQENVYTVYKNLHRVRKCPPNCKFRKICENFILKSKFSSAGGLFLKITNCGVQVLMICIRNP